MGQCISAAYGPDYEAEERAAKAAAQGLTPMHAAAAAGDTSAVLRLGEQEEKLGWPGRSLKATNIHGSTPLHLAAYHGHVATARALIALGSSIAAVNKQGHTPLHLAAAQQHPLMVHALLLAGAQHSAKDTQSWTPLHCAAAFGSTQCIDLLTEAGAAVDEPAYDGRTPLALAAGNGEEKAVRVLLALGACGATADNEGATPLHLACKPWKGQEGCIAALLDAEGVELAATDRLGQVPLHYAARHGNSPAIRALLGAGADPTFIDSQGHTPLDVALEAGHQGAVESLLPPEDKTPTPPQSSAGVGPQTPAASHAVTPSVNSLDNLSSTPSAPPLLDQAGPSSSSMAGPSSSSGNGISDVCVVCLDNPRQTVLIPCGHRALCQTCAGAQRSRHCPICRTQILSCVRVFDA